MIWIDASFAIEWLLGTKRAADAGLESRARMAILPMQYAEVCVYFFRRDPEFPLETLDAIALVDADANELAAGALLYIRARAQGSKASLADAVLAATVLARGGELYTFDGDFRTLGLKRVGTGRWAIASRESPRPFPTFPSPSRRSFRRYS